MWGLSLSHPEGGRRGTGLKFGGFGLSTYVPRYLCFRESINRLSIYDLITFLQSFTMTYTWQPWKKEILENLVHFYNSEKLLFG